mmetsp:Transcript_11307/g.31477  ORF Transcript_11307/g.31477 Transcript_11307/m.31477 type:complete len:347 (-) Transcript_11307:388-1428(-)
MSLHLALVGDFVDVGSHHHLNLQELSRLEAAHPRLRQVIVNGSAWSICVGREVTGISLQGELFAIAVGTRKDAVERRRQLKALLSPFCQAQLVDPQPLPLVSFHAERELAIALQRAHAVAATHLAQGGQKACVVVGTFNFPDVRDGRAPPLGSASAIAAAAALGDIYVRSPEFPDFTDLLRWNISSPLQFSMSPRCCSGHGAPVTTSSGGQVCPAIQEEFDLQLGWKDNIALLNVSPRGVDSSCVWPSSETPDGASASAGKASVTVDLCTVSRAPLLRTRGTVVCVGGPWRRVRGVCAAAVGPGELIQVLSSGSLCVACIRDGGAQPANFAREAYALHLEAAALRR